MVSFPMYALAIAGMDGVHWRISLVFFINVLEQPRCNLLSVLGGTASSRGLEHLQRQVEHMPLSDK
jgi:hypothetical protein